MKDCDSNLDPMHGHLILPTFIVEPIGSFGGFRSELNACSTELVRFSGDGLDSTLLGGLPPWPSLAPGHDTVTYGGGSLASLESLGL